MRKLKWHEQKLLKKVDLLAWKSENGRREIEVMRRYHVQDRDDYKKYNKLAGMVSKLCGALRALPGSDAERIEMTRLLSARLYAMGLVNTNSAGIRCVHTPNTLTPSSLSHTLSLSLEAHAPSS